MTDEAGFLAHLRANPADVVARLVFADWLEERGDQLSLLKADYLQTDDRLAEPALTPATRDELILRLRELADELPTEWKLTVARVAIENCMAKWRFVCPQSWAQLKPTLMPTIRTCTVCRKKVHYCATIEEAQELAAADKCVAVDLRVRRNPGDLWVDEVLMGDFGPNED